MRGSGAPIRQQKCDQVSDSRKTTTLLSWVEETWHGRHSNSSGAIEVLYSQSCHNHNHNVTTLHTSDTQRNTQNHTRVHALLCTAGLHIALAPHCTHALASYIYLSPGWYLYVTTFNLKLSKPFRTLASIPRPDYARLGCSQCNCYTLQPPRGARNRVLFVHYWQLQCTISK
jgi:hypothetical protein